MIKVFLVDDEIIMRESLRNFFMKRKDVYELVGEAPDGELALPMILKNPPDILITDICMPFMDGLELAQHVRDQLPNVKIMMISGYDDGSYTSRADEIGVQAYIRKPITSEILLKALNRVVEGLPME